MNLAPIISNDKYLIVTRYCFNLCILLMNNILKIYFIVFDLADDDIV